MKRLALLKALMVTVRPGLRRPSGTRPADPGQPGQELTSVRMNISSTPRALDLPRRRASLAVIAAAGLASTPSLVWAAEKPVTHTVVMKATSYAPIALTIRRGDSVVWINQDPFPHTVTSAGAFDSKSIAAGTSWKYKPRRVGEYAYTCTFHPNRKGTLRVE